MSRWNFIRFFIVLLSIIIINIINIPNTRSEVIEINKDEITLIRKAFEPYRDVTEGMYREVKNQKIKLEQEHYDNIYKGSGRKVAYLTFDDGPTPNITTQILDILMTEKIEATFFIIGKNAKQYPDIIKRINKEGHLLGNHSYSHSYKNIYQNTDIYIEELIKTEEVINDILQTEYDLTLTRFPGGMFGSRPAFIKAINEAGYTYIDWNALNGDSEGKVLPKEHLVNRLINSSRGKEVLVILMHDAGGKITTVEALPEIMEYLKAEGYVFLRLDQPYSIKENSDYIIRENNSDRRII
ncbi:polysaccharide deacetylase family protein [Alkaliphilus peptidifermentans]|uniref:Peptidoglycan/xylan/chitin deacetylase, PgdA/CDA1 family n=1 Tax=Alkaliphilus peptidifermentans DSM 18978 TaxID=1120976 RepID=A0A1G5FHB2_9FIRM|nr:polysaccharide deacetylase family protein [Alkaliphilus peptidifermentans]SCY38692.1 Peptidoglycan/xylan/chitin deacetylase, PgdA/CDA1 family [Alkaliphilus peptidifermentans DSM 18978]